MSRMNTNYPDQIAELNREIIRLNVVLRGRQYGLQPGAENDVIARLMDAYYVEPDRASVLSHSGENLDDALQRLSKSSDSKHLFGVKDASKESDTLAPAQLATMSPLERMQWANERAMRKP